MASKRANKYVFRGAVGLTAIAHEHGNGMLPQTLRHRVCRMGLSIEEALGIEQLIGVRKPDLLHPLWKLALGMAA
ncbi:hypothetical protein EFU53_001231 [Vibrio cholerae]|uniref:hypothetical protein n=1 Tax=Vibrio cholerae TaxID=666 RepID=UPI001A249F3D|nr:hypothetical protein [Vibrio cholerae]EGR0379547.1 hypothetical protein [Vibrio cholerae]EJL6590628.1 hypothetical protein [Vibrio cholerae]EKF9438157.1 hypothetical protein [Vibrio cholerae]EKY3318509.1 hypothetical protein [Vibrio cholerae]UIP03070.1 hypothetical protein LY388_13770 [Vibrio cholerae]